MAAAERFDMKLDSDEKMILAKGAALMGTSMAGFVRSAAKQVAQELIERESRIVLSRRDAEEFCSAMDKAFDPNPALAGALSEARKRVKRA